MEIFLSYASEDRGLAEPIAFSLRARGHSVFLDRDDLPPGGEYDLRIEKAVAKAALFVFLISEQAVTKGRFTLTELEFARKKWRRADGHILPVMVKPTSLEKIPNVLKSVTILEPQGNIAAEVAATVDSLAQDAPVKQAAVFGIMGVVSGFSTWFLYQFLSNTMSYYGLDITFIPDLNGFTLSLILSAIPLGIALLISFTYFYRMKMTYNMLILFVLIGWASATYVVLAHTSTQNLIAIDQQCQALNVEMEAKTAADLVGKCASDWRHNYEATNGALHDLMMWGLAGALGALAVAIGVPLATRRTFKAASFLLVTGLGVLIAAGWFVVVWRTGAGQNSATIIYTVLFVLWQGSVSAAVGYRAR